MVEFAALEVKRLGFSRHFVERQSDVVGRSVLAFEMRSSSVAAEEQALGVEQPGMKELQEFKTSWV